MPITKEEDVRVEKLEKELESLRAEIKGTKKQSTDLNMVPGAIIIAGLIIAGSLFYSNSNSNGGGAPGNQYTGAPAQPTITASAIKKLKVDGEPFIGSITAPLTMFYWFDYQCPFCKQFEVTVMPNLVNDYVNTGKIRIIFKDFQFLGPDSTTAGLFSQAVWEAAPDKFYEWHKAMYDKQDSENSGWGNKSDIIALTKTISGIDEARVESLVNAKQVDYQKTMDANKTDAQTVGGNGTPYTLLVGQNGKNATVNGARDYASFKQSVDSLLK